MVYTLVHFEVVDYGRWRTVFDAAAAARQAGGVLSAQVFQQVDRPEAITVLLGWSDLAQARAWQEGPQLRAAVQEAGYRGAPTLSYLVEGAS